MCSWSGDALSDVYTASGRTEIIFFTIKAPMLVVYQMKMQIQIQCMNGRGQTEDEASARR